MNLHQLLLPLHKWSAPAILFLQKETGKRGADLGTSGKLTADLPGSLLLGEY